MSIRSLSFVLSSLFVVSIGCDPEPETGTTAAGTTTGSDTDSASSEASGTTTTTTDDPPCETDCNDCEVTGTCDESSSGGAPETTGGPTSCLEATTPEECAAVSNEFTDCGWFETTVISDLGTCEVAEASGVCLVTSALDGCDELFLDPVCEGVAEGYLWRPLGDGLFELLPEPTACGGPGDFEPCPSGEELPAAVCDCACTLAGS